MAGTGDTAEALETQLKLMEERLRNLTASFQALKAEVSDLHKTVDALESQPRESSFRYVISCPDCSSPYDMLAHHYSIGLFDNMVYVKCPKCNKAMPVKGGDGGSIEAVSEESH